MDLSPDTPITLMFGEPVKCAECGTWWRGAEHRCPPPPISNGPVIYPMTPGSTTSPLRYCSVCYGWHAPGMCRSTITIGPADPPWTTSMS